MAQSDRSNSIWQWHYYMVQLIGSLHISSQCCSTFKCLTSACYGSRSTLQKPSTFPSSTCIDLLRGDSCMLYGGYFICYMWSNSISYMLTAACCGCIGSSKSRYLVCSSSSVADIFCQDQTHSHCHVHCHAKPSESCHDRTTHIKGNLNTNVVILWSIYVSV